MGKAQAHWPLISCIMPTADRRAFVPSALRYFLRQDYEPKELIVVDDGNDAVSDLIPPDERIRYIRLKEKKSVGAKRNLACEQARGEIIAHWDDDDWHAPHRLSYQVEALTRAGAGVCGIKELLFYEPEHGRAWRYRYSSGQKLWLSGSTLCYRRSLWMNHRFRDINVGEDLYFIWDSPTQRMVVLEDSTFHVGIIHRRNVSPKQTGGSNWRPFPVEEVRGLMKDDWEIYNDPSSQTSDGPIPRQAAEIAERPAGAPTALVSAALGVGDILRVTPLIRALHRLGYQVDVLLAPDYPEVIELLSGAPEIRRLYCYENFRSNRGAKPLAALAEEFYDVAVFTTWSAPLGGHVRARRVFEFSSTQWLKFGDSACVEQIGRSLGWRGPLPPPFVVLPERHFDLPPGTVALHPGCKPDWPWKKWHGFDELARQLPSVVIIGTASDLDNEKTYFGRPFEWPEDAKCFVGALSLQDTAALLRECSALVSNDSGMMHLGVAVGIPTFGVFGITNPHREAIPAPNMFPVSKGLACEPACREQRWGRRDCEHHLECLKTLSASEVLKSLRERLPGLRLKGVSQSQSHGAKAMDEISLVYYANVFDASGYGHAARAYIHALHHAGIQLSVVDLAAHPRQAHDELVESLLKKPLQPDFHLFHGIPPQWANRAFRLPNAIGMTVWETDVMPSQWRNPLNHVLEVWLPCEHNVSVFNQGLERPVFKLPHPVLPARVNGDAVQPAQFLAVAEEDVLFFSIFEWQERKNPLGLIQSFLRAFPEEKEPLLIIKTNPGAAGAAREALAHARREARSEARVEIRAEAWTEAQIEALQARGDCYVSLHRGEGWCYPLFDAASRGTPVVATNYSGPLDYLNPQEHRLVQYESAPVNQAYVYYHPGMRWAEPDLTHAAEQMRWVYHNRAAARDQAEKGASRIRQAYSTEAVGALARERLLELLSRTQPQKWQERVRDRQAAQLQPPIPIPGEWYDAGYFEYGTKSNWGQGYKWSLFASLFQETAGLLTSTFTEADSYLDIGCANGFLVRALREQAKECWGFDHSKWATDRAEPSVKPFVIQAGVDDVSFDRQFDVLLAFSIFESLTETQILSFLSRARGWTRQAILAVIATFESEEEERRQRKGDRDLSRVTLKPRRWWDEAFQSAGWRQDYLHRIAQRTCQTHPLPSRMGWEIYVYAPS